MSGDVRVTLVDWCQRVAANSATRSAPAIGDYWKLQRQLDGSLLRFGVSYELSVTDERAIPHSPIRALPFTTMRTGVLLLQLGTPDSTSVKDVRKYLKEFLSDPRVLTIPAPLRWALVRGVIMPFRAPRSAHAYEKVWTDEGSPLLVYSNELAAGVQADLGDSYLVEVGMRYGEPSISSAVERLTKAAVSRILILPMFPQYASASGGSAMEKTFEVIGSQWAITDISTFGAFFDDPGFVEATAAIAQPLLDDFSPDFTLFSYHGLPEQQIRKSDPSGIHCLDTAGCCDEIVDVNQNCYRAQAFATTRAVVGALHLDEGAYDTSFQSRLAGQPWIQPFTDKVVGDLHANGVRRLAVLCPSFVADCLETIEEIGIRLRKQWVELGGEELLLVPCVNDHPLWVQAVCRMIKKTDR